MFIIRVLNQTEFFYLCYYYIISLFCMTHFSQKSNFLKIVKLNGLNKKLQHRDHF